MSKAKSKAGEAPAVETNEPQGTEVQAAQEQAVEVVTEAAETESSPVSKPAEDDPKVDDPAGQAPLEALEAFLRRVEGKHIDRDVVATAATHPHASEITWPGTYGGIRLSAGPVSVTYSDGTTE
ncbi:hypothetical protein [Comamonas sp. C11]|uniref:hypothetical protein n=1 Tax=Comamonas sp. C11 TaxID=2966554 RepID=UPI0021134A00|nr:hypothetical protein [Comamonas sp. C11]UUC95479.1 hypothetical protein NOX35_09380 [Comamonas sp. C11]